MKYIKKREGKKGNKVITKIRAKSQKKYGK